MLPEFIRVDNGPEFTSRVFQQWCKNKGVKIKYIQPGSPSQNAFIERFNRHFREDVLDAYWFEDLEHLRAIMEKWRLDYNENHPHKSLGGLSPKQYLAVNSGKVPAQNQPLNFTTINSLNNNNMIKKLNLNMS